MMICCLDLEGVLTPEIWINVAKRTRIKELFITTREEPDYDKLMKLRLGVLRKNNIRLRDIQADIAKMNPLPGAKDFLKKLRIRAQVIIVSDTFYEFAGPLMEKLNFPVLFCNSIESDRKGFLTQHHLRQPKGKHHVVNSLKHLGFTVRAAGDSYNDISMLQTADKGVLFRPPMRIVEEFPQLEVTHDYKGLLKKLTA